MRLYFFIKGNETCVGIEKDGYLCDISNVAGDDIINIITYYDDFMERINEMKLEYNIKIDSVKILAPYYDPQKIICCGRNYLEHCNESLADAPKKPVIFAKYPTAIIGTDDFIVHPEETQQLDYEAELAVIIGCECKGIKKEDAFDYVFGYSIMNEVSARDIQFSESQWVRAKSFDTFAPFGPCIVTKDEITDPHNLAIKCRLNGVTMQDANTGLMIFKIPELIEFISRNMTLLPGDVIITGTPSGVGHYRKPPIYLIQGSVVEAEIENIGILRNSVIEYKA